MFTYWWFKIIHDEITDDFWDEDLCAVEILVTPLMLPALLFIDIVSLPYQLCIFLVKLIRKRVTNNEKKR